MRRGLVGALLIAAALALPHSARAQFTGELVDRAQLRVCATPQHLPFSNERGEGFENKVAELIARELNLPLAYTWYPNTIGFVRNTLRAGRCDLIMGVVAADELVQNTNPYYRSSYVLARRAADADRLASMDSPAIASARIGLVAGTPPSDLIQRRNLFAQVRPYQLMADTRYGDPAEQMIKDLEAGQIDVALAWGPIAGWAAKRSGTLRLDPLPSDPRSRLRMDFRISMGIRPDEPEWKRTINELIAKLQPEIDAILTDYGIPRLDEQGRLITAAAGDALTPPEPAGYRMDEYRAPVPATLAGATVLTTAGLHALIASERPVLADVLPRPRKPAGRTASQVWIDPKREHLPGSVWLANVGYGELSADYRRHFEAELGRLTAGDKARPIVFYCDADCWMSWNAAKRAMAELGYRRVYWYPEGVQGWREAGHQVVAASEPREPAFSQ